MSQSPIEEGPWDPGLQNERTRLAWQRTILSGLACSLLVSRLLVEVSLPLAIAVGLSAVVSSALLAIVSSRRYVANNVALQGRRLTAGARSQLVVTGLVVITAIGACCYLATQ